MFCIFIRKSFSQLLANYAWQFKIEQKYLQPGSILAYMLLCRHLCTYETKACSPYILCVFPIFVSRVWFLLAFDSLFSGSLLAEGPSRALSFCITSSCWALYSASPENFRRCVWHGSWDGLPGFPATKSSVLFILRTLPDL